MHWHDVVWSNILQCVDGCSGFVGTTGSHQVKASNDGVNPVDARRGPGLSNRVDHTSMAARRDHDESLVSDRVAGRELMLTIVVDDCFDRPLRI